MRGTFVVVICRLTFLSLKDKIPIIVMLMKIKQTYDLCPVHENNILKLKRHKLQLIILYSGKEK